MDDLRELYQATILEHNKRPRNFGQLAHPTHEADGHNPLCGDALTVQARVDSSGHVAEIAFRGQGCAISKASASLMTEYVKGKSLTEIESDFTRFHELVTGAPSEAPRLEGLGKLAVFSGVREYPVRVKCATLAWHALRAALSASGETAKTE